MFLTEIVSEIHGSIVIKLNLLESIVITQSKKFLNTNVIYLQ